MCGLFEILPGPRALLIFSWNFPEELQANALRSTFTKYACWRALEF